MLRSTKPEMDNNDGRGRQRVEGDNGLLRRSDVSAQIQEYHPEGRERPSGSSNLFQVPLSRSTHSSKGQGTAEHYLLRCPPQ